MAIPQNKYDRMHLRNLEALQRQIDEIFRTATDEAARIGVSLDVDTDVPFSFDDYPKTKERVKNMLSLFQKQVEVCIVNGIQSEWTLANNKNNELCNAVFGDNVGKLSQSQYRRYYSTNLAARDAFIARKQNGLGLSDRVWQYTNGFKTEMEMGLDLGIRNGLSADEISRDLRQYLQHPDMLFRRVRDEHGILHLSKRAAAFHPGRGVYRSSYLNAKRLAVTETNAAYRTADHERWQNLDFVVGIEIHLSGNHTCKGRDGKPHEFTDICDELAGKYPKDFKFTGWHPHCRCYATTILKTEEEMAADDEKILKGEPVSDESVNEVKDVPEGFKKWLKENEERAKTRFSVPDFFTDNINYIPKELIDSYASRMPYDTYAEYESAMKYNKKHSTLSEEQKANIRELNKTMPVIQGKIMNFSEADDSKCNPDYSLDDGKEKGFYHNCQTCTLTYELRRRGYKVKAKGNPILEGYKRRREMDVFYRTEADWTKRFLNSDGSKADYDWSRSKNLEDTVEAKKKYIVDRITETGRYEIYCGWKKGGAHVFIVEKTKEGNLIWYDPQTGNKGDVIEKYVERMKTNSIGVLRIDDKIINTKYAKRLVKVRK